MRNDFLKCNLIWMDDDGCSVFVDVKELEHVLHNFLKDANLISPSYPFIYILQLYWRMRALRQKGLVKRHNQIFVSLSSILLLFYILFKRILIIVDLFVHKMDVVRKKMEDFHSFIDLTYLRVFNGSV